MKLIGFIFCAFLDAKGGQEVVSRYRLEIPSNDHYCTLITNDYKYVKQAIGVAFDPSERRIYWSDAYLQQIVSSNMAGMDFRSWNHTQMHKPEFLAIDYAERNIYYSDSINKSISVCTIDGNYCQVNGTLKSDWMLFLMILFFT